MLQATPTFPGAPPRDSSSLSPLAPLSSQLGNLSLEWTRAVSTRDRWIYALLAVTLVLNLLDGMFTLFAVRAGLAIEANPLMDELLSRGAVSFMLGKIAIVSLGVLLLWRLRRLRMAVLGGCAAFFVYAGIFVWHLHGLV